jgi:hypothetical protein
MTLTRVSQIEKVEQDWERLLGQYQFGFFNGPVHFNFVHYRADLISKLKYQLYFVIVLDEADRVCCVLPTFRRRLSNKLVFLNGEDSEIILCAEREDEILNELGRFFGTRRLYIYSNYIHQGSRLQKLFDRVGWQVEEWNKAFYTDLSSGYDAYFQTHSVRTRQKLTAEEKRIDRLGVELVVWDALSGFEGAFADFLRLHLEQWGERAASLNDARHAAFMREFARYFLTRDRLFLSFLKIAGVNVSVYFGLKDRKTIYYLSSGRDAAYEKYGLGKIHMLKIFKWCCVNHIQYFDFLSGQTDFKSKFATHSTAIFRNRPAPVRAPA